MTDDEKFAHTVTPWTVGDLRRALDGVPDDTPIKVTSRTSRAAT